MKPGGGSASLAEVVVLLTLIVDASNEPGYVFDPYVHVSGAEAALSFDLALDEAVPKSESPGAGSDYLPCSTAGT